MKTFLFVFTLVASALTANASYLVWQVMGQTTATGLAGEWDTANIYRINEAGEKMVGAVGTAYAVGDGDSNLAKIDLSKLTDEGVNYSYYIELVSNTKGLVGYTVTPQTYEQLAGSIAATLEAVPSVTPWHGGPYNAPEPTSAMLMLLGVAGLALRRKQRKIA